MSESFSELLRAADAILAAEARGLGASLTHAGELGRGREDVLREQLRKFLPAGYSLSTGFVVGETDISKQQDILIYDGARYPAGSYGSSGLLLVPESVYCSISVRSTLSAGKDLDERISELVQLRQHIQTAVGGQWPGFTALFSYAFKGNWSNAQWQFAESLEKANPRGPIIICALGHPLLFDGEQMGIVSKSSMVFGGVAGTFTSFLPGAPNSKRTPLIVLEPTYGQFAGLYQLLLTRLTSVALPPLRSMTLTQLIEKST